MSVVPIRRRLTGWPGERRAGSESGRAGIYFAGWGRDRLVESDEALHRDHDRYPRGHQQLAGDGCPARRRQ